jgi:hypothetical protein
MGQKKKTKEDISALRSWWSNKYNKPSNAPELLLLTSGQLLREFYEDLHQRRDQVKEDIRSGSGNRSSLEETLRLLEDVLEIGNSLDSWQAEVEAALVEGRTPDWTQGVD